MPWPCVFTLSTRLSGEGTAFLRHCLFAFRAAQVKIRMLDGSAKEYLWGVRDPIHVPMCWQHLQLLPRLSCLRLGEREAERRRSDEKRGGEGVDGCGCECEGEMMRAEKCVE